MEAEGDCCGGYSETPSTGVRLQNFTPSTTGFAASCAVQERVKYRSIKFDAHVGWIPMLLDRGTGRQHHVEMPIKAGVFDLYNYRLV